MITPRDVTGVTVAGSTSVHGVNPRELSDLFKTVTRPYNGSNVRWLIGANKGMDVLFLNWLTRNTLGYIHVVTPRKLENEPPGIQRTIKGAMAAYDDFQLTELDLTTELDGDKVIHPKDVAVREMVNHSTLVIGFPHERDDTSHVNQTLSYAASLGLPRIIWPVGK